MKNWRRGEDIFELYQPTLYSGDFAADGGVLVVDFRPTELSSVLLPIFN
jgi:hypothetical protein